MQYVHKKGMFERKKKQIKLDSAVYVFYLDDALEAPKYKLRYIPFFPLKSFFSLLHQIRITAIHNTSSEPIPKLG